MKVTKDTFKDGDVTKWKCDCGTIHEFDGYVHAHWNDALTHTCAMCGAQHSVLKGVVRFLKKGKAKK